MRISEIKSLLTESEGDWVAYGYIPSGSSVQAMAQKINQRKYTVYKISGKVCVRNKETDEENEYPAEFVYDPELKEVTDILGDYPDLDVNCSGHLFKRSIIDAISNYHEEDQNSRADDAWARRHD